MLPKKQQHFTEPASKVVKAKYPDESCKGRISAQITTKLRGKKWWWEGTNLYIKYYKDSDFKELKIILLFISHDIRVDYPKISKRVAKIMFTHEEINKLYSQIKV